ncbi:MAG: ABC transporter ATP-binding protein [Acutalibacteraceae bacterium]
MNKKVKNGHSTFSNIMFFIKLLWQCSPKLVIGQLCVGIFDTLPGALISVIGVKFIIDVVAEGENLQRVFYAVALIAIVIITKYVFMYFYNHFFLERQREKVHYLLNKNLYERAVKLDEEKYDDPEFYNDFILTIESSSDNIQNLLGLVQGYVGNFASLVAVGGVLFTIDPVCLVIIGFFIGVFLPLSRKIGSLQMDRRRDNTMYHRRSDYFQRIFYLQDYCKEVRMNDISPLLIDRYNDAADDVIKNQKHYMKRIDFLYIIQESGIQVLGFMFVLPLYLGYCVLVKGSLSAGDFVATFNGAHSIAMSINFLTIWAVAVFSERGKMIEKYREFLNADFKIKDGEKVAEKKEPKEIKIENLSFTYNGNSEPSLKNINLTIKPYEKIALVGYNGAGKTTLTNLLLRLYDPTEGSIKIDGEDIRELTQKSHRDRFAAVFQDFQLFSCTLGQNVALDRDYDEKRVKEALSHSGFNKEMKNGTETELLREFDDEGAMLSGGESQKVAISRAFYKDCPYVILDEPSANLDPIAEYNLNRAMMEAASHKTVIFISHRLSTTVGADKIYVMEKGEIIESGSHEQLMAKDGTYAYMFKLQAEKYQNSLDK